MTPNLIDRLILRLAESAGSHDPPPRSPRIPR
jgi:hypothetical protein